MLVLEIFILTSGKLVARAEGKGFFFFLTTSQNKNFQKKACTVFYSLSSAEMSFNVTVREGKRVSVECRK